MSTTPVFVASDDVVGSMLPTTVAVDPGLTCAAFSSTRGLSAAHMTTFLTKLGVETNEVDTTHLRDVVFIPKAVMEGCVAQLPPIIQGRILAIVDAAVKFLETPADATIPTTTTPTTMTTPPTAPPTKPTGKNISEVLDQADDGVFEPLTTEKLDEFRKRHVDITGDHPPEDERPSSDQLSALDARLRAGRAPFVDLGIWGPWGDRHAKYRKSSPNVFVDGEWCRKLVQGPLNYPAWRQSWRVFRAAMICLGAATPAVLDAYKAGIKFRHEVHGNWVSCCSPMKRSGASTGTDCWRNTGPTSRFWGTLTWSRLGIPS